MVKIYGPSNGFGWKLNEVIGAQIVSVPMDLPIRNANRAFVTFMGSLAVVFAVLFVILNVMLTLLIVRPITMLSEAAEQISKGKLDIAELPDKGRDEVSQLGQAFNRMRRSLEKAISLIDKVNKGLMTTNALPAGYALHEYRIEKVLGVGGFGLTYLALDANLNLKVAVKEYLPDDIATARRRPVDRRRARPTPPRPSAGASSASSTSRARSPRSATRTSCA